MKEDEVENGGIKAEQHNDEAQMEKAFDQTEVPSWKNQLTIRSLVVSVILSLVFNVIVLKLVLTTGIVPSLNVASALIGYAMIKSWTVMLEKCGLLKQPFTRQENTVIQTCVVASSGVAFSSGMGSYVLGMTPKIAAAAAGAAGGFAPINMKTLSLGWMIGFLFVVSFVGLFSIVPLRKMMILRYKLIYPSGTATAYLINSFHTPTGAKLAKKQVWTLFKSFIGSFLWGCFKWFFTGHDDSSCGFGIFPVFGFKALAQKFYYDSSASYIGVGMICPYMVNISMLIGAVISWGILWPRIQTMEGKWYPHGLKGNDLHGIQGYRIFFSIALMLGDGLFHFAYMLVVTIASFIKRKSENELVNDPTTDGQITNYNEKKRTEYFLKDQIPNYVAISGYVILAILSTIVVPIIFYQLKWYHVLVSYCIAPVLAFCNAYGCGLTDWSLASNYGKLAIIIFSAWVGLGDGGIIAGLAACGVMMSIVSTASDLMQDFKTGYLTLSSPRSMFFSQVFGTAIGCVFSPLVFWFFNKAYNIGDPSGLYSAPFAGLYRGIALIGSSGFSQLPKNCLKFMIVCFCVAVAMNMLTAVLKKFETKYKIYRFIPSPMCMAIPFYLGGYFVIDMCIGSLILFIWKMKNKKKANDFSPAVASGLICGESLWAIPAAILSIVGANPPICMSFSKNG